MGGVIWGLADPPWHCTKMQIHVAACGPFATLQFNVAATQPRSSIHGGRE